MDNSVPSSTTVGTLSSSSSSPPKTTTTTTSTCPSPVLLSPSVVSPAQPTTDNPFGTDDAHTPVPLSKDTLLIFLDTESTGKVNPRIVEIGAVAWFVDHAILASNDPLPLSNFSTATSNEPRFLSSIVPAERMNDNGETKTIASSIDNMDRQDTNTPSFSSVVPSDTENTLSTTSASAPSPDAVTMTTSGNGTLSLPPTSTSTTAPVSSISSSLSPSSSSSPSLRPTWDGEFSCLINPGRSIEPNAITIHKITKEMVLEAPGFRQMWFALLRWIEGLLMQRLPHYQNQVSLTSDPSDTNRSSSSSSSLSSSSSTSSPSSPSPSPLLPSTTTSPPPSKVSRYPPQVLFVTFNGIGFDYLAITQELRRYHLHRYFQGRGVPRGWYFSDLAIEHRTYPDKYFYDGQFIKKTFPRLHELYSLLTNGCTMNDAHSAIGDSRALATIYHKAYIHRQFSFSKKCVVGWSRIRALSKRYVGMKVNYDDHLVLDGRLPLSAISGVGAIIEERANTLRKPFPIYTISDLRRLCVDQQLAGPPKTVPSSSSDRYRKSTTTAAMSSSTSTTGNPTTAAVAPSPSYSSSPEISSTPLSVSPSISSAPLPYDVHHYIGTTHPWAPSGVSIDDSWTYAYRYHRRAYYWVQNILGVMEDSAINIVVQMVVRNPDDTDETNITDTIDPSLLRPITLTSASPSPVSSPVPPELSNEMDKERDITSNDGGTPTNLMDQFTRFHVSDSSWTSYNSNCSTESIENTFGILSNDRTNDSSSHSSPRIWISRYDSHTTNTQHTPNILRNLTETSVLDEHSQLSDDARSPVHENFNDASEYESDVEDYSSDKDERKGNSTSKETTKDPEKTYTKQPTDQHTTDEGTASTPAKPKRVYERKSTGSNSKTETGATPSSPSLSRSTTYSSLSSTKQISPSYSSSKFVMPEMEQGFQRALSGATLPDTAALSLVWGVGRKGAETLLHYEIYNVEELRKLYGTLSWNSRLRLGLGRFLDIKYVPEIFRTSNNNIPNDAVSVTTHSSSSSSSPLSPSSPPEEAPPLPNETIVENYIRSWSPGIAATFFLRVKLNTSDPFLVNILATMSKNSDPVWLRNCIDQCPPYVPNRNPRYSYGSKKK